MGFIAGVCLVLAALCGLASLVGFVLLDIRAFRESPVWGLLVLFLSPIAAIVFAVRHWDDTRRPFLIYAGSFAGTMVLGLVAVMAGFGAAAGAAAEEFERAQLIRSAPGPTERPAHETAKPVAAPGTETVQARAAVFPVEAELTEPAPEADFADDRTRRTLERTGPSAEDEPVPAGYTVIAFGEAKDFVGRRVRVLDAAGNVHEGRLTRTVRGGLIVERELGGGTVSYALERGDVHSLQIYFR